MTLKDLITIRGQKFQSDIQNNVSMTEFWKGYEQGWVSAYGDLLEILEENNFNLNIEIENKI